MIRAFFDWSTRSFAMLAGIALVLMMVQINLDVIGRFVFNAPLPATTEIVTAYLMVAIVFLPLARVELANGHVSVDLLAQFLPPAWRLRLHGLACLAAAGFFALLTLSGWEAAVEKYEIGEYIMGTVSVVVWPSRFFVPFGAGLMTLLLLYKAGRLLAGDAGAAQAPQGAAER